jgi:hypothetical protein
VEVCVSVRMFHLRNILMNADGICYFGRAHQTFWCVQYEGVSKIFRTGCLARELQLVQLSPTKCSFIATLWVNLVSFAAITLCVASQRVFVVVVVVYFVIDSVRKLFDTTPSYMKPLVNFFKNLNFIFLYD